MDQNWQEPGPSQQHDPTFQGNQHITPQELYEVPGQVFELFMSQNGLIGLLFCTISNFFS